MGCCENRELSDNEKAEAFITETELKLEICRINLSIYCTEANNCFKIERNSIPITDFFKRLKINMLDPHISRFFNTFYLSEINSKKFTTLGILLCTGSHEAKVTQLFFNYIEQNKNYLTEENANLMLSDIFEISISELISFAKEFSQGDITFLEKYNIELDSIHEFSRNYYISKLFEDVYNNKLRFEVFNKVFGLKEVKCLLEPSQFRVAIYGLMKTVQRAHSSLNQILRQPEKYKILE